MLDGPRHRDVADQHPPLGQRGPVLLGGSHHQPPGLVVAQQAVDPVDLEGQVGGRPPPRPAPPLRAAGLLQRAAREAMDTTGGDDGEREERDQQDGAVDGGHGDGQDGAAGPTDERQVADPLVVGLGLFELAVALFDAGVDLGVLGVGADRLGRLGQVLLTVAHLVGHVPQAGLVDAGQRGQVVGRAGSGWPGRSGPGRAGCGPGPDRCRPAAARRGPAAGGEGLGDVLGPVDVDHPVAAAVRAEDGVAGPGVGGHLEVDARASGAQAADQLGDQPLPLERADAGDHRQAVDGGRGSRFACRPRWRVVRSAPSEIGVAAPVNLSRKAYVRGPSGPPAGPVTGSRVAAGGHPPARSAAPLDDGTRCRGARREACRPDGQPSWGERGCVA